MRLFFRSNAAHALLYSRSSHNLTCYVQNSTVSYGEGGDSACEKPTTPFTERHELRCYQISTMLIPLQHSPLSSPAILSVNVNENLSQVLTNI